MKGFLCNIPPRCKKSIIIMIDTDEDITADYICSVKRQLESPHLEKEHPISVQDITIAKREDVFNSIIPDLTKRHLQVVLPNLRDRISSMRNELTHCKAYNSLFMTQDQDPLYNDLHSQIRNKLSTTGVYKNNDLTDVLLSEIEECVGVNVSSIRGFIVPLIESAREELTYCVIYIFTLIIMFTYWATNYLPFEIFFIFCFCLFFVIHYYGPLSIEHRNDELSLRLSLECKTLFRRSFENFLKHTDIIQTEIDKFCKRKRCRKSDRCLH